MVDPVTTADGHSYERDYIEKWFLTSNRHTSPNTNIELTTDHLKPNVELKSRINMFWETNKETLSNEYKKFETSKENLKDVKRENIESRLKKEAHDEEMRGLLESFQSNSAQTPLILATEHQNGGLTNQTPVYGNQNSSQGDMMMRANPLYGNLNTLYGNLPPIRDYFLRPVMQFDSEDIIMISGMPLVGQ